MPAEPDNLSDIPFPFRKKWAMCECERLEQYGFLRGRYELLEGHIVLKEGRGAAHGYANAQFLFWLTRTVSSDCVRMNLWAVPRKLDSDDNRPEIDIAVYRDSVANLQGPLPSLTDLILAVEISDQIKETPDAALAPDLAVKAGLYARSKVPQYWVLDTTNRRLLVHRKPVKGNYAKREVYEAGETVPAPFAADTEARRVEEFFAPVLQAKPQKETML